MSKKSTEATTSARSNNERMILEIIRRSGGMPRAGVASLTNLTQQSVHRIIDTLVEDELLLLGDPIIQGRGQPSPQVRLNPAARYSVGVSINTDSALFCITDFTCQLVHLERVMFPPTDRKATLDALRQILEMALDEKKLTRGRLAGVGFAIAGYFVEGRKFFVTPDPLDQWSYVDVATELRSLLHTKIWTENNSTSAAIGEAVLGAGLKYPTFGYLSFNYGFGAGVVIDGQPLSGAFGNAGEISRLFPPHEMNSRPALGELIKRLRDRGIPLRSVTELRESFDPNWPGVAEWVQEVAPQLNRAIDGLRAVIDPAAIVFGGELPQALGELLLAVPRWPEGGRYGRVAPDPVKFLSSIEGDPAVLGAALIPLKSDYFS